jgi:hypothetical protein
MLPAVNAFIGNVRAFCAWVESDKHDCLTARQLLLVLMHAIPDLRLQDEVEPPGEEIPRREYDGWKSDFARFDDLPFHFYRTVHSSCDVDDDDSVVGDLRDDLADIYGDLWHGLMALDRGHAAYAVEHWHDSYCYHWGHHASQAVHAIDDYFRKTENW